LAALDQAVPVIALGARCWTTLNAKRKEMKKKGSGGRYEIGAWGVPTVQAPPGRPGLTPPAPPKKKGKSPEEWEADLTEHRKAMRAHFASIAAFNRERAMALGITSYKWLAVDVHGCCNVAKKNGDKVFSYLEPPPEGHVGEGQCDSPDWCRCIARPMVPGFS
jgi:hypothetical protein